MSYILESLGERERLLATAHIAWAYKVAAGLVLLAGVLLAFGLHAFGLESGMVAVAIVALSLIGAGVIMAPVWTTEIGVTSQRLIVKRGILGRTTEELQLWSIEQVDLKQDPLSRLFGFGNLIVSGTGDDDMRLPLISNALEFRKAVQQAISDARPNNPN